MLKILSLFIPAWQSYWARQHGGGDQAVWLSNKISGLGRIVSCLLFSLPIAFTVFHFGWIYFLIALAWAYVLYGTGHAVAYDMGNDPSIAQSGRMETLSYIVNPICNFLGIELGGTLFCWIFMTLKGLLFSIPLLKFAPLSAILYTLGYSLGYKFPLPKSWGTFSSEWYSGALVGIVTALKFIL